MLVKMNQKIAKTPNDLNQLEFVKLKGLMRKELLRVKKYTSAEKPAPCIISGSHAYKDKPDMLLMLLGTWKGKFKRYAKQEVIKESLGAIGIIYFVEIDDKTQQQIFQINLAKGKGKKQIGKLQKKLKKLIPQSKYQFKFGEMEENALEQLEVRLEQMPEEEEVDMEDVLDNSTANPELAPSDSPLIDQLAAQIEQEATAVATKVTTLFDVNKEPSLKPLVKLIKLSQTFWKKQTSISQEQQQAATKLVYKAYAQLERVLYDHWKSDNALDEEYADFILAKIFPVFVKVFEGQNNKGHQRYGTGLKVRNLAKNYNTYQVIHEIGVELNTLARDYMKDTDSAAEVKELNRAVEDTKSLLTSGQKLLGLIQKHYKDSDLCTELLQALSEWEDTRILVMDEMVPYIQSYYDVIQITLTRSETAQAIRQQALLLVKNLANMQLLVQKFDKMNAVRSKIERLDKGGLLTNELEKMQAAEERLKAFALSLKEKTESWITNHVDPLVEADEQLIQSNQITELEQTKLQQLLDQLQQQSSATTVEEANQYWEAHPKEKEQLQVFYETFQQALEDNTNQRTHLNTLFNTAYQHFATLKN